MIKKEKGPVKQRAELRDWQYVDAYNSLSGTVHGHPKLEDGKRIITSAVKHITKNRRSAETANTIYKLTRELKKETG